MNGRSSCFVWRWHTKSIYLKFSGAVSLIAYKLITLECEHDNCMQDYVYVYSKYLWKCVRYCTEDRWSEWDAVLGLGWLKVRQWSCSRRKVSTTTACMIAYTWNIYGTALLTSKPLYLKFCCISTHVYSGVPLFHKGKPVHSSRIAFRYAMRIRIECTVGFFVKVLMPQNLRQNGLDVSSTVPEVFP